jgi:hypothetical protein
MHEQLEIEGGPWGEACGRAGQAPDRPILWKGVEHPEDWSYVSFASALDAPEFSCGRAGQASGRPILRKSGGSAKSASVPSTTANAAAHATSSGWRNGESPLAKSYGGQRPDRPTAGLA